jgi:MFS family permease
MSASDAPDDAHRLGRPDERGQPFSWRFTTPMFLGSALNPINSSLIATALVPIARGVHVSVGQTVALVSVLYLASAIAQPTFGKLSEEFGPRRVFLAGITVVLAGGLVGGFGHTLTMLVISRVLIGIGTSGAYPSAMLMIRRRAESAGMAAPPGGVLGGLQIAGTAAVALGLPIGGVLVNAFGWRSVFFANVPVTVVALVLGAAWLPRDPALASSLSARGLARRIDLAGIVDFGGAIAALLVFLDGLPHPHWISLALAAVLAIALVVWELRASPAFFDVRLLATNLALSRTYLRFALTSLCVYTVLYGVSQWLEAVRGYSAQDAGLLILPMAGLSAVLIRPISRRNLVRGPLIAAAVSSIGGAIGVLLLGTSTPVVGIVAVTLIFGVTVGTFAPGNQTALYTQVDAHKIATAAGLLRTFGYIGSIGSAAILSVVFHKRVTDHGLHEVAAIMIGASIVVLLFTLADRSLRKQVGSEAPTKRPTATHGEEEITMHHIRPSASIQEAEAQ